MQNFFVKIQIILKNTILNNFNFFVLNTSMLKNSIYFYKKCFSKIFFNVKITIFSSNNTNI